MTDHLLLLLLWCSTSVLWLVLLERAGVPSIAVAPMFFAALAAVAIDRLVTRRSKCHERAKHARPNTHPYTLPSPIQPASIDQSSVAFGPHWKHWKAGVVATYGGQEEFNKACAICVVPDAPVCRVAGTRTGHLVQDDGTVIRGQFLLRKGEFVPHGYAIRVSNDGAIHEGEWLAGEPEGMGFRTTPDGRVVHGYWSGEVVDSQWSPPLWF